MPTKATDVCRELNDSKNDNAHDDSGIGWAPHANFAPQHPRLSKPCAEGNESGENPLRHTPDAAHTNEPNKTKWFKGLPLASADTGGTTNKHRAVEAVTNQCDQCARIGGRPKKNAPANTWQSVMRCW